MEWLLDALNSAKCRNLVFMTRERFLTGSIKEDVMNVPKSNFEPDTPIEEEISNTVRSDGLAERRPWSKPLPEPAGELSETIRELVQKVGGPSIAEIERLIGDLQAARNYLKAEAERIQQETARYAHLSDTASASVKIIIESLSQWRKGNDAMRSVPTSTPPSDSA
jgi:hypothetical protein